MVWIISLPAPAEETLTTLPPNLYLTLAATELLNPGRKVRDPAAQGGHKMLLPIKQWQPPILHFMSCLCPSACTTLMRFGDKHFPWGLFVQAEDTEKWISHRGCSWSIESQTLLCRTKSHFMDKMYFFTVLRLFFEMLGIIIFTFQHLKLNNTLRVDGLSQNPIFLPM